MLLINKDRECMRKPFVKRMVTINFGRGENDVLRIVVILYLLRVKRAVTFDTENEVIEVAMLLINNSV